MASGAVLALAACASKGRQADRGVRDASPGAATTDLGRLARVLRLDAAAVTPTTDPPAPPGDLAAEIAQFTTLDACVRAHASQDPLVSDALRALGYDTFLRDACRTLEAAHSRSAAPCSLIDASGLRRECATVVAVTTHAPDDCPFRVDGVPRLGRDATCLALASSDPRLCAGGEADARARCEAIATGDGQRCRVLGAAREACARDVARWRTAIGETARSIGPSKSAKHSARWTAEGDASPIVVDLRTLSERGVVLTADARGVVSLDLGRARDDGAAPVAPAPEIGPRLALTVSIARDGAATVEHLEVELPGRPVLVVPPLRFEGRVSVTTTRKRGDSLALEVSGKVITAPRSYDVEIEVETFVEDGIDTSRSAIGRAP